MKKNKNKIIMILIIIVITIFLLILSISLYKKIAKIIINQNLQKIEWVRENTEITITNKFGENIYSIIKNKNISPYNSNYQQVIDEEISNLLNKKYTISNPLLILNPYGTNNLGLNIYFTTEEKMEISYTISVNDKDIPDFSRTLKNNESSNYETNHSYQIIGLVPGKINYVKLTGITENNEKITTNFTVDMTSIKCQSDTILKNIDGSSNYQLTDGLFVLFGLDKAFYANNYIYDNNGVLRADLVLNNYRSDRIIFYEDKLIYSYDTNAIAIVNRLGKIEKKYTLDGYTMHHDYIIDSNKEKLLILVNSDEEEDKTIEDLIISLDLKTGIIEEIIDMKKLLPQIYQTAIMPESGKNTYGGTGLDWIHLNSLSIVDGKEDIIISGREISTIIYVQDIYNNPTIKCLIADEKVYEGTDYESLLLNKIGSFVNQAGQHTITYVYDKNLPDGQYYLEMYNNNYGKSSTRKDFPWDSYLGVGTYNSGNTSKYYKYLIDEKNNTYQLVEEFDVAYSSIVSSIQDVKDNHVTSSGKSNCFAEYDMEGNLIKQFNYTSKKYAYRVFKYDFKNIWFK